MNRALVLVPLLLLVACPGGPVDPGTDPTPTNLPATGYINEGFCFEREDPPACEPAQVAGAACTVRIANATGVTVSSLGFRRDCAFDGDDPDGYPSPPRYPVLTGGQWPDGDVLEHRVHSSPYTVEASGSLDPDFHWGGLEFVCEDGEDIDLVLTNDILYDGVLTVLNDGGTPLVDVRTATDTELDWSENLLSSNIPAAGLAHLDPPDGAGYVRAVDSLGGVSWRSWRLAGSAGTCFFVEPTEPPDSTFAGEPCRWTIDNATGLDSFVPSLSQGGCDGDGHSIFPYPHALTGLGATFDLYAPPGEWQLTLRNDAGRYEVYGLQCEAGEALRVEVGPDQLRLDDPCE